MELLALCLRFRARGDAKKREEGKWVEMYRVAR
jgi:hypothetical protein